MHGRTAQLDLPWQGRSPAAAQASYEAAVRAEETAQDMCGRLRRYLRDRGMFGATDAEIEIDLKWRPNVVTARRNDLVNAGEVVVRWPDAWRTSARRTTSKRKPLRVTVWILSAVAKSEAA